MKRAVTLKENYEFRRLYQKGASAVGGGMVLYCRKNRLGHTRLGGTVSVKLGHAVVRTRARRRLLELKQRGQETELETVLRDIVQRDEQDRNRAVAPLRQAEDAVLLDTTELGLEESLKALISLVKGRLAQ